MKRLILTSLVAGLASAAGLGCKDEPKPVAPTAPPTATPSVTAPPAAAPTTKPAAAPAKDEHPNAVALGTTTSHGLTFVATQDEPIKAGGEGAFDLKVTGYPAGQKPKAVRFWVGVESGEGSAKAKAAEETPDVWHTHAEVPNPIPAGSKFWAEVEPATGEKFRVSFDLKQ